MLSGEIGSGTERTVRNRIQDVIEETGTRMTPYGLLIESMASGVDGVPAIEYVNPFAYLHLMCSLCLPFFMLINNLPAEAKLVIYIDEVCPGNPLRPEKSRMTQAIYWTMANLPDNILVQSGMWLLFSVLRSSIVEKMPGGVSGLIRKVMHIFFGSGPRSFKLGIVLHYSGRTVLVRGVFSGYMADEKALKEIFGLKGASGSKPCITCRNVVQFLSNADLVGTSLVGIACRDVHQLRYNSNANIYQLVDKLRHVRDHSTKAELAKIEQIFGMHCNEDNLLFDDTLRDIIRPVDHYLRDWMHTLMSNGVAGTQVGQLLLTLKNAGLQLTTLSEYAGKFNLPKTRGKVNPDWFLDYRVCSDHLRTFASEQMNMLPILDAFLKDVARPLGTMGDHIKCFKLLYTIVQICALGPSGAVRHVALLRQLTIDHGNLFERLYPDAIKPKYHHLFHLPENMDYLGVLLSCFPTERKHRSGKSCALRVFRHYEHTVLRDLVNQQFSKLGDESHYSATMLVSPQRSADDDLSRSTVAHLPCGYVHSGDIVMCTNRELMHVVFWWEKDGMIVLQGELLQRLRDGIWVQGDRRVSFVDVQCVVCPITWAEKRDNSYRVCLPKVW